MYRHFVAAPGYLLRHIRVGGCHLTEHEEGRPPTKVIQHVEPDMSQLDAQRNQIRDDLKSEKARDRDTLFEAGVRDSLIKQGKLKVDQQALQKLIANYQTGG